MPLPMGAPSGMTVAAPASISRLANTISSDVYGRTVRSAKYPVEAGYRRLKLDDLGNFTPGFYLLKIQMGNQTISRKMVKQ